MRDGGTSGFVDVDGVALYWESHGDAGVPLVVLHGGFGSAASMAPLVERLADTRQVVALELRGHGHSGDDDRPFSFGGLGDDVAAVVTALLPHAGPVDLLGYSLGGGVALATAFGHPGMLRRLVVVSYPFRATGWFPGVRAGQAALSAAMLEQMRPSPAFTHYAAVAPEPARFATLMDKTRDLVAADYDWSAEVAALSVPTLVVLGDCDAIAPAHAAEFFALLGGGLADPGWDGGRATDSALAVLPGRTHYDIVAAPDLAGAVAAFTA